jgi:predicted DNA-binding protein (UPF0251 family)
MSWFTGNCALPAGVHESFYGMWYRRLSRHKVAEDSCRKRKWLSQFLDFKSGIPSHDRFNAILAAIRPGEFEACLLSWITDLHEITAGQVVAIDGKTLRRSFDAASGKSAIHMVSAWATANQITLGQAASGSLGC